MTRQEEIWKAIFDLQIGDYDENKNIFIAYMKKDKNNEWFWCNDDNFDLLHSITHWMPFPEPPKNNKIVTQ